MAKSSHAVRDVLRHQAEMNRYLKSIRVSPSELQETRVIARRHHQHLFDVNDGVATISYDCECGAGHGEFKSFLRDRSQRC